MTYNTKINVKNLMQKHISDLMLAMNLTTYIKYRFYIKRK